MIIRESFVTNSSSTSFIIISKDKLTADKLTRFLGAKKNTPLYGAVNRLARNIIYNADGFYHHSLDETNFDVVKELFGEETAEEYKLAENKNLFIYCGRLSSDEDYVTMSLCMDFYKKKSKKIFLDFSDCGW